MRVSVEMPDRGTDPLLKQLVRQFDAMQKQMRGLKSSDNEEHMAKMMAMMHKQQDVLLRAIERLAAKTTKTESSGSLNGMGKKLDALKEAVIAAGKKSRNRTFGSNY